MIIQDRKLFWRTANIIFEDDAIMPLKNDGKYGSIVSLSYHKLDLPGFVSYSKPTLLINLTKSEEDIMRGFNDTTRNEIRKTMKDSSLSFRIEEKPSTESYEIYSRFEYSQGRVPVSRKILSDCVSCAGYCGDDLISGVYVIKSGQYLRIRSIFSKRLSTEDKELYKIIAASTRRVIWEACLWGKGRGYRSLDMASVNPNNPKTANIAKFKMSFGKELVPEYTYIYKSPSFALFEKFARVKIQVKRALFLAKKSFL